MKYIHLLLAATIMSGSVAFTAFAEDKPLDSKAIEEVVKKVIQDNPELIIKSLQNYELKKRSDEVVKASQNLKSLEGELKNNAFSPVAGNPQGDVTIVEFFDYHCGYCKRFFAELKQFLEQDKNVRVVFKEFPILSEDSKMASKAALAVNTIDKTKYLAFHNLLMKSSGGFDMNSLTAKAKEIGIDSEKFTKAMENPAIEKELENNRKLAEALNISGTPGIIIGQEITPGAIGLEELKARVASARAANANKNSK